MSRAGQRLSGNEKVNAAERAQLLSGEQAAWYAGVQAYMRRWVEAHKDGAIDTWTAHKGTARVDGVWQ